VGCKNEIVDRPENLISEDQMIEILYDMAIMEGIRLNNPAVFVDYKIDPAQHLFEKYKIDSLQFAESNFYYASDVNKYLEMYQKIQAKIDLDFEKADSLTKILPEINTSTIKKSLDSLKNKKFTSGIIKQIREKKE
jgi:hypothetical protein